MLARRITLPSMMDVPHPGTNIVALDVYSYYPLIDHNLFLRMERDKSASNLKIDVDQNDN